VQTGESFGSVVFVEVEVVESYVSFGGNEGFGFDVDADGVYGSEVEGGDGEYAAPATIIQKSIPIINGIR